MLTTVQREPVSLSTPAPIPEGAVSVIERTGACTPSAASVIGWGNTDAARIFLPIETARSRVKYVAYQGSGGVGHDARPTDGAVIHSNSI